MADADWELGPDGEISTWDPSPVAHEDARVQEARARDAQKLAARATALLVRQAEEGSLTAAHLEEHLSKGATIDGLDADGYFALLVAARHGHAESVRLLLDFGADVHQRGPGGLTPLHEACFEGHEGCAQVLLEHGADPRARDEEGVTPVQMVVRYEHGGMLHLFPDDWDPVLGLTH